MRLLLNSHIITFGKKLSLLNTADLSLEPYPLSYLTMLLHNHAYYLRIYAHVLEKLLDNTHKPIPELSLVDYGAGNGLLGLFAKHCGFAHVYLNDHNAIFLDAARQLATKLGIVIAGYIHGDYNDMNAFLQNKVMPDAIAGTDVIEHIYDLEGFFSAIALLNKNMVTVFTTASVTENPLKTRQLIRLQHTDECIESNAEHAMPGNEYAGLAFLEIRKRIIRTQQPQLSEEELSKLAVATRGMNKPDIIDAVGQYSMNKTLPVRIAHRTNTCDPVTGSWTERLLRVKDYEDIYNKKGFTLQVYHGFYNQWQPTLKAKALQVVNLIVRLLGKRAGVVAPFITLAGKKS